MRSRVLTAAFAAAILCASRGPALAQGESLAALLARAPRLGLEGKVAALTAPIEIGGAGWGAFRRLCVARMVVRPDGGETPESEKSCVTVAGATREGATWRLTMRTGPIRGGPSLEFSTSRDAGGIVGPVAVEIPAGQPAPPPEKLERLRGVLRLLVAVHGLPRMTVTPGVPFAMTLPLGDVGADLKVDGGGFACRPEGTARRNGRAVLVAACSARGREELAEGWTATVDMAGRFAIDVETGMVLQHNYASHTFMPADPKGSMKEMRMRGVSRQTLD